MPTQVQFRRGTSLQVGAFTGAPGEIAYDTEQKTISVQDGTTPGGSYLSTYEFANAAFNEANAAYALADSITPFTGTSTLTDGSYSVTLDADGIVNLTPSFSGNSIIASSNTIQLNAGSSVWTFGSDGLTTFPNGYIVSPQYINNSSNTANASFAKANAVVQTAFVTISANGASITPSSNNDTLTFTSATSNGINILNPSSKTIDLGLRNSGVSFGVYGDYTNIPAITVDTFGRITSASNTAIQDIRATASPKFDGITSNTGIILGTTNIVSMTSNTYTTGSTAQISVDSFSIASYRSAKYLVQMIASSNYHMIELNVVHDGTNTSMAQYGEVIIGSSLGSFQTSITSSRLDLLFTPTNAVTEVKLVRTALKA